MILAALVSLGVIVGIYTSVQGASLTQRQMGAGAHLVSGSMVNLDHFREAQPKLFEAQVSPQSKGHDCEHDQQTSPDD
jgi:hypothetical protein